MAQGVKEQVQDNEQKAKRSQRSVLRSRIKAIATKVIKGDFHKVTSTSPYQPQQVQDANHPEWRALLNSQENLMKRIAAAKDAIDGGQSRHALIISLRHDFPDIAKKNPEPVKPKAKSATPPPAPATTNQQKRKQITLDDEEDDDDDEEYDPTADGRAQREERASKRQRSVAQDTTTVAADPKPMMDDEDLDMQLEEIQMKAELQKLQLKRKYAADKKRREQRGAKIKKEQS